MTATPDVDLPSPFTGTGTIKNPATGSIAGEVRWTDPADVPHVAASLRTAQKEWEARGPKGRAKVLARYAVWLGEHRVEIEKLLIDETGKSAVDAAQEVPLIIMIASYYIKTMERILEKGKGYVMQEITRLEDLVSGVDVKLSQEKRQALQKRVNVLTNFVELDEDSRPMAFDYPEAAATAAENEL